MTSLHAGAGPRWPPRRARSPRHRCWCGACCSALLAGAGRAPTCGRWTWWRDAGNMAHYASELLPARLRRLAHLPARNDRHRCRSRCGARRSPWSARCRSALLCSANITPWWVHQPVRRLMDACRAINEMVFAHAVHRRRRPRARSPACWRCGCTPPACWPSCSPRRWRPSTRSRSKASAPPAPPRWRRSSTACIPQVMPLWISYALYRFESNVRSASVVGMVGAGGIGVMLWDVIRGFQYAQTCARC